MRIKDFLRFLAFSSLFLVGLFFLTRNTGQQPKRKPPTPEPRPTATSPRAATAVSALAGLGAHAVLQKQREQEALIASWKNRPAYWHEIGAVAGPTWAVSGQTLPSRNVILGGVAKDSPFHLEVTFDSRGAAIRKLILNKFDAADPLGRPEKEPLALIPEPDLAEEHALLSSVLYHYESADSDRPVDTLARAVWEVVDNRTSEKDEEHVVSFQTTTIPDVKITKTYRLPRGAYHVGLEVKLQRTSDTPKKFRYQLAGAHGLPVEGRWYTTTFRHSLIGQLEGRSLWRNYQDVREIAHKQGGEAVGKSGDRMIQYAGVAVQYFASVLVVDGNQVEGQKRDFLESARPTLESRVVTVEVDSPIKPGDNRITVSDKRTSGRDTETYQLTEEVSQTLATMNLKRGEKVGLLVVPDVLDRQVAVKVMKPGDAQPLFHDDITVRVKTETLELPGPNDKPLEHRFLLYNGPIKAMLLNQLRNPDGSRQVEGKLVDHYVHELHLNTLTDYHSPGGMGKFASTIGLTFLIIKFTNLCHLILYWLHLLLGNFGICIILLTVIVRGAMFPLSRKQALMGIKMQALTPELKKLKEKFKDDRQGFAMAQMELFRKHKVNPLGSCWMLLLQLPIFMGLYYCLQESVHFRLEALLWMPNLAAPDMLIPWGENIPWISRPEDYGGFFYLGPYLNILPILAVTLMIYQQKVLMPPPADEQQAMQQKMMKYMMIFFGLLFYKVAAGLCIYFIASSLWGFTERKLLPKKSTTLEPPPEEDRPVLPATPSTPARPAVEEYPSPSGSNRGKRRQERKRGRGNEGPARNEPSPIRERPREGTEAPAEGWWANLRRRISDWWQDVLRKASKK